MRQPDIRPADLGDVDAMFHIRMALDENALNPAELGEGDIRLERRRPARS